MTTVRHFARREFLRQAFCLGAAGTVAPQILSRSAVAAAEPAGTWQIGCFTRPWAEHDYRVALDAIAEAGFKYAGLMTTKGTKSKTVVSTDTTPEEAQQIAAELTRRGLQVPCVWGGAFPLKPSVQAGIDALKKLIDHCAVVGSPALMIGGTNNEKIYDDYYKAVAEACPYAAEKRVGLVLKPHGGLNATGPQCRKTVERVGRRNFTLWYDPGNIFFYSDGKLDPATDAAQVAGLVSGMCVKDFAMASQEGKPAKEVMITPGTGRVDFRAVLAVLKKGGFTGGPLVVECLARGELPALLAEAKKARKFVEELVA
jgi:sugar phosphate isomerase/epimerase